MDDGPSLSLTGPASFLEEDFELGNRLEVPRASGRALQDRAGEAPDQHKPDAPGMQLTDEASEVSHDCCWRRPASRSASANDSAPTIVRTRSSTDRWSCARMRLRSTSFL